MNADQSPWLDRHSPFYIEGAPPTARHSLALFADILGFSDDIQKAEREGNGHALLHRLRAALDQAYVHLSANVEPLSGEDDLRSWDVKTFTDNIVVGYPITLDNKDGEAELGQLLSGIAQFQLEMVLAGFFVRGGLAVGDLYMDRDIVWGRALLDAYGLEQQPGGPPRILLGNVQPPSPLPALIPLVLLQLASYARPINAPHNSELLFDGAALFVDYLALLFDSEREDGYTEPDFVKIKQHKFLVEEQLRSFVDNESVRAKYEWVAGYHNWWCDQIDLEDKVYRADESLYSAVPQFKRIAEIWPTWSSLVDTLPEIERRMERMRQLK